MKKRGPKPKPQPFDSEAASLTWLKDFMIEAKVAVARSIDAAVIMSSFQSTAAEKKFDWSQIKAVLKAQILDERDENGTGEHLKTLLSKAEKAQIYADTLTGSKPNKQNFISHNSHPAVSLAGGRTGQTPMRAGCDDNAPAKETTNSVSAASSLSPSPNEEACGEAALDTPAPSPTSAASQIPENDPFNRIPGFLARAERVPA